MSKSENTNDEKKVLYQVSPAVEEAKDDDNLTMKDSMDKKPKSRRIHWFFAPAFLLFWLILFFAVVLPIFFRLPQGVLLKSGYGNKCTFVAERAYNVLYDFEQIGPKVVGSIANEYETVDLLLREIESTRAAMDNNRFDMEVDVQQVSGAYMHWHMINMYQGVQNVVVKLSPKNATSESYLLINSHFDSKPGSPGSGDDGTMVVIMLEMLRVIATSNCQSFKHPIVFLFNGAEENPLQASHGFITQHKWAKNCKALINLDCAGSGHRELMFQSGPNHPWLMNYYKKNVRRPFATSVAEELFQSGIIPSDTDFRIFRNFGKVPGLDIAHTYNGYVYHTKHDKMDVIPLGTLQASGENLLPLALAYANAPELEDPSHHAKGRTVFYDFLGLFFMYYTDAQAKIINNLVSCSAIVFSLISLCRMSVETGVKFKHVLRTFMFIFLLHFMGFVLALVLPLLIAVAYDMNERSMTWFSSKWLVIGQYIIPSLFGLSMPTVLYMSLKKKHKLPNPSLVQMALHSQAIILSVLCSGLTKIGSLSSYVFMIPIFFYVCSLIFNLVTQLHGRGYSWVIPLIIGQIMPFLYVAYLLYIFLINLMPMMGRFGAATNPDLFISGLCALGTILSLGFIIPALSVFRRSKTWLVTLLVVTFAFVLVSLTDFGFPYRPKTNVGRVNFLNVRRVFYNYEGAVERNESGYYFDYQDRLKLKPLSEFVDLCELESVAAECNKTMMCGLPVFNHRWYKARKQAMWLPSEEPIEMPGTPTLELRSKVALSKDIIRLEFQLTAPPHFSIFVNPLKDSSVVDWSFLKTMLEDRDTWKPPYHIFVSYGKDNASLDFYIDIQEPDGDFTGPLFELGISAHYVNNQYSRGPQAEAFIKSFPPFVHVMEWPSSYERYIF